MNDVESTPKRDDFRTAIICAVPKEAEAVEKLFSKTWTTMELGRHPGDKNTYTAGRIGNAFVVVVWLDDYGRTKAASATVHLLFSFKNIEHALVVGICGGVPNPSETGEIVLGDVVISTELKQYDVGKQYPNGYRTNPLAKPRKDMRAFLNKLSNSGQTRRTLVDYSAKHLQHMLSRDAEYAGRVKYPGQHEDILHSPAYVHKHRFPSACYICTEPEMVCENAMNKPCSDLNCDSCEDMQITHRVQRRSASKAMSPTIHFGVVGSGDTVMKSAQHRDQIAEREGVIAFEMEGAGVHEEIPSTVVIKGVCDYADSHKNKKWQRYAATVAAACTGAFLELKEEEYGCSYLERKNSHASIATMDSAMSNISSSANTFTAEPSLTRHASEGGGIALSPYMRTVSAPYQMVSSAEGYPRHRTQSLTSQLSSRYGTPMEHGFSGNGWNSPNLMSQSRVSIPEVPGSPSDQTLSGFPVQKANSRSQTYPPPAPPHHQQNVSLPPTPHFPTLASLSLDDQNTIVSPLPSTDLLYHQPCLFTQITAEEAARLLLDTNADPAATTALLNNPNFSPSATSSRGKTIAHLLLGTANVFTNPQKMQRIASAIHTLYTHHYDFNAPDNLCLTPLHWCVKTGNTVAARHLIAYGVNVNAADREGRTPLYLLAVDGSPVLEMGEVLLKAGGNLGGKKLPALSGRPKEAQRTVRGWVSRVP
jgi:nucleoside phosphorylase